MRRDKKLGRGQKRIRIFMPVKFIGILLIAAWFFSGCSTENQPSTVGIRLPNPATATKASYLEQEVTVTLFSYYGPKVREAQATDILSRINAAYLNLESGDRTEANADIYYQLSCGSMCYPMWTAMQGAIIMRMEKQKPSLDDCVRELQIADAIDKRLSSLDIVPNSYACILIRSGRVGWIRYDDDFNRGLEKGKSRITYWVWDKYFADYSQ